MMILEHKYGAIFHFVMCLGEKAKNTKGFLSLLLRNRIR
jgi:hypothetical protein